MRVPLEMGLCYHTKLFATEPFSKWRLSRDHESELTIHLGEDGRRLTFQLYERLGQWVSPDRT